ncbi:hypothetical protein AAG906_027585 [Vitis piasezkii]
MEHGGRMLKGRKPNKRCLVVDDYCYALQLWWKKLPWLSKVVPMEKKNGREKEKTREEREVGSCAESSSSKGNKIWRVVELDGDGMSSTDEVFSALGKKNGGKGR